MEKTSVYLTTEERQRLAHLARSTGRSQAQIIREAIATYDPAPVAAPELRLAGAVAGPAGSVAGLPEEELLDGFGGG